MKTVAHNRSPKQEKSLAKRIGGRRVGGSGCGTVKGDVRKKGIVRIECKNTTKKSFSVTRTMIEKIEHAALQAGEIPVIEIEFIDGTGRLLQSCCVVPTYVLEEIIK